MRTIIAALAATAALAVIAAPAQAVTVPSRITHAPNYTSLFGVKAPGRIATVSCASAGNYDIFVSFNEATFIAAYFGQTLRGPFYWSSCADVPSSGRTYVKWHYPASGGLILNMEAYLYDRFDSNGACSPATHSPDLGNVSWALRVPNGPLYQRSPDSLGTYPTPCE